jgi:hypothetical protein
MSIILRIILIVLSIITFILCVTSIAKAKMRVANSVVWMLGGIILIIISIFPNLIIGLSNLIGIESPANFVFLVMIFFLLIELFSADKRISELNEKLKNLDHYLALKEYNEKNQKK